MPKNLKITFLILIIILSGVFICYYFFWLKSPASSSLPTDKSSAPLSSPQVTDAQRLESLNKASNIPPINPNMTYKERLKLLNKPSNIPPL